MEFIHTYLGYNNNRDEYNCEILNEIKNPVTIIALTANTFENDKEKCFSVGMNEYLSKPFTAQQLIKKIEKYIPSE